MPRRIEIRKFENPDGEFGYSVDVYCRDKETILKSRVFSAIPNENHFFIRTYETKAEFLGSTQDSRFSEPSLEHNILIAGSIIFKKAKECLENFQKDYHYCD